jgi:hypothetical protein
MTHNECVATAANPAAEATTRTRSLRGLMKSVITFWKAVSSTETRAGRLCQPTPSHNKAPNTINKTAGMERCSATIGNKALVFPLSAQTVWAMLLRSLGLQQPCLARNQRSMAVLK